MAPRHAPSVSRAGFEPELRCRHLALSDATGEPETIKALDAAADIAQARGVRAAAAELLQLAISLGADDPARRILCATHHFAASDPVQARQLLQAVVGDPTGRSASRRGPVSTRIGPVLWRWVR